MDKNNSKYIRVATDPQIKSICEPFMKALVIKNISYVKLNINMTYLYMNTSEKAATTFANSNIKWSFTERGIKTMYFEDEINCIDDYKKVLVEDLDFHHGISYLSFSPGFAEMFTFHVDKEFYNFKEVFLKNLLYIERFMRYFKLKTLNIQKQLASYNLHISNSTQLELLNQDKEHLQFAISQNNKPRTEKIKDELEDDIINLDDPFSGITLNYREAIVLEYLLSGLSYKMIGKKLNLSWLTIRDQVDILRDKFDCKSKNELISLCNQYHVLDILNPVEFNFV